MNKSNVRLNEECHKCVRLSKGICRGKETVNPCIVYECKAQYAIDSIKRMKELVKKQSP